MSLNMSLFSNFKIDWLFYCKMCQIIKVIFLVLFYYKDTLIEKYICKMWKVFIIRDGSNWEDLMFKFRLEDIPHYGNKFGLCVMSKFNLTK
jgi:hypothetical protein